MPFFINDNVHYARWLSIHLNDMVALQDTFPDVYEQFMQGKFAIHKSGRAFSGLAVDQAHEQNSALIKGDGGAVGITEDESALRRWMIAGPEVCILAAQYDSFSQDKSTFQTKHHEEIPSVQKSFFNDVRCLTNTIEEMGNTFLEESKSDLLTIDTKYIIGNKVEILNKYLPEGSCQFKAFTNNLKDFYSPLKRNNFTIFSACKTKRSGNENTLKQNYNLFSNLFISCQTRQIDLDDFFQI
eukprot:GHVU01160593.1.p1 GENE.GHVU01160593.1~~GHVU01160593.1.p1  ORF type:complete len:241 (-),score=23.69 GHVU01160593.1:1062-1784(-)